MDIKITAYDIQTNSLVKKSELDFSTLADHVKLGPIYEKNTDKVYVYTKDELATIDVSNINALSLTSTYTATNLE
jgi:hypothetical protein